MIPIVIILIHGLEYWVEQMRLIVEIDGIISQALIDSGAMISMMSKGYCYECGYKRQPLEHLVPIESSEGASVPYLGYVGVRMCISGINSFDRDVSCLLALLPPDTIKESQ